MNMDCFLKRFSGILLKDDNDSVFQTLKILLGGTTSPRIAKLLNFAVSQMGSSECYVETGVFTGATLISSSWNNGKICVGIDCYGPVMNEASVHDPEKIKNQCIQNISVFAPSSKLIAKDFRKVGKDEIPSPIGVSFIDARHTYEDVIKNLEWLDPLLADDALVVFDDVNFAGVSKAISEWLMGHEDNYDLITYIKPFYQNENYISSTEDRILNNGVCVLRYHRNPASKSVVELVTPT